MRIRKKHVHHKILIRKGDSLRVPSQVPEYLAILTLNLSIWDDGSWYHPI